MIIAVRPNVGSRASPDFIPVSLDLCARPKCLSCLSHQEFQVDSDVAGHQIVPENVLDKRTGKIIKQYVNEAIQGILCTGGPVS